MNCPHAGQSGTYLINPETGRREPPPTPAQPEPTDKPAPAPAAEPQPARKPGQKRTT